LSFTLKSSFFDEINYWTWGDFENNTDMEVTVTPKKLPRVFVKYTQWSKIRSTLNLTWYAELWGGAYPCSKRQCVRYVCPILNLWIIIISSRRDKRNKLITFTLGNRMQHVLSVRVSTQLPLFFCLNTYEWVVIRMRNSQVKHWQLLQH